MNSIPRELLEEIRRHAVEEYPFECCGLVLGVSGKNNADAVRPVANIQNRLHESDPAAHPRDARTAYFMDPGQVMKVFREAMEKGLIIKTFYHSHPEHDAYFSAEDRKMAVLEDEPAYPEASYLVVSVYDRKVKQEALFAWNPQTRNYEEREFTPC